MAENNKTVLVVEDEPTMREIMASKLSGAGYRIVEADNGEKAIEMWEKEKPDLVLLDLILPEIDGFHVLENMRKNADPKIANAKVIVLSNLWSKEDIEKTKKHNIEEFMVKAYHTTDDILKEINKALKT